ncbi:C-X-C motif chemokine 11-1-like [Microcaecilia unicolor]|uniref:C-X-C motif chemokine 11-1-like n=1 Tax=Microcaecilia unicolor TaxID=1415580 RepID=A0A6P7X4X7_9AMPH|nr:C-X-C motif chemokine 11-1-like [Microcaecilia unicolor]
MGKFATLFLVISLCVTLAEGLSIVGHSQRCLCDGKLYNLIPSRNIRKVEMFPQTPRCYNVEIVITMKTGKRWCLNPKAQRVRAVLGKFSMKRDFKHNY